MTPGKLFALTLVLNILVLAVVAALAGWAGRSLWHQHEAERDASCRLALTVQLTRRDSVNYAVDHHCESVLTAKP